MPRPYVFNAKFRRYAVWVKTGPHKHEMTALRSNRTAAGMTYTARRSELLRLYPRVPTEQSDISAISLSVHGTTDSLMFGLTFRTKRLPCPCCGATNNGKLVLNERGRERLRSKRSQHRLIQRFKSAIYKGVTHMTSEEFKAEFDARMKDGRINQGEVLGWLHDVGATYPELVALVDTNDDLEVDDKPLYSEVDEGVWVMCWSWVPYSDTRCLKCDTVTKWGADNVCPNCGHSEGMEE